MEKEFIGKSYINYFDKLLTETFIGKKLTDEEYQKVIKKREDIRLEEAAKVKELEKIVGTEFTISDGRKFRFIGVQAYDDYGYIELDEDLVYEIEEIK